MKVLDLFSGLEGWSGPFRERGHEVVTLDMDPKFGADFQVDFLSVGSLEDLERYGTFDLVLASPPCESFSTGSFRHHWHAETDCRTCGRTMTRVSGEKWEHGICPWPKPKEPYRYSPKTEKGALGLLLLARTLASIAVYQPWAWIIENPRAMMRNLVPERIERRTVTWCQYGDTVMKPTDLWGGFPLNLELKPPCKNGDPCHEAAPRGAKTGTQGKTDAAARGKIPYDLALAVCIAAEEIEEHVA